MWRLGKINLFKLSFVRFLVVGFANTSVGLLVIYAGKWFIGLGDIAANLVGYSCGLALSFVLNKNWSFSYKGGRGDIALFRFLLVILVAYLLNLSLTMAAIFKFGINSYWAQALGIVPYTIITYLGSRYFAFPIK